MSLLEIKRPLVLLLLACVLAAPAVAQSSAAPQWWQSKDAMLKILDPEAMTAGIRPRLKFFTHAFSLLAFAAVTISAIRRVAKARSGEESMGWIAGVVMTTALIATGPALGRELFSAIDALAESSGYKNEDAIETAWEALKVILPPDTPSDDVLDTAEQAIDAQDTTEKQDAAWTKRAWDWMKRAWGAMKDASTSLVSGLRSAVNHVLIFLILLIPALALLLGMVTMAFGSYLREVLHQLMDVLLPMMIGMLAFAPMRGPATNFLLKYISLSLWPLAWALGNAVALSMLTSTMSWVVTSCRDVITTSNAALGLASVLPAGGLLPTAAPLMSWGLLIFILFMILFSALLMLVSAVSAPLALSSVLTKGASFAEVQIRQALSSFVTASSAAASLGGSSNRGGGVGRAMSDFGSRSGGAMSGIASRLNAAGAAGGPFGVAAAFGASMVSRTVGALHARGESASQAVGGSEHVQVTLQGASSTTSMLETLRAQTPDKRLPSGRGQIRQGDPLR